MPFGVSSGIPNVIIHAKFHVDRLRGFWAGGPPKVPFPILIGTTLTTVLHYRADCDNTANGIAWILMTLSNFQGHSPSASIHGWYFSYNCAVVDKSSTEIARRAVPLRKPSFLAKLCISKLYKCLSPFVVIVIFIISIRPHCMHSIDAAYCYRCRA